MNKNEKFVIFGNTSLTARCIEWLQERKHAIVALLTADAWLKEWACRQNLPIKESFAEFEDFDYLLSIANRIIIPPWLWKKAKKLSINYHDSILPRYAGVHATTWALLNKEKQHGITWHLMTEKVDAGDILKQVKFAIDPNETTFTLNIKCYDYAFQTFQELLQEIEENRYTRTPQDLSKRTYFGLHREPPNQAVITWNESAEELQNLFAALDFGPHENRFGIPKIVYRNQFLYPTKIQVLSRSTLAAGVVTDVTVFGIQVATKSRDVFLSFEGKAHESIAVGDSLAFAQELPNVNTYSCLKQEDCMQLFEKNAQLSEKIALEFASDLIDYRTLNLLSNKLAQFLIKRSSSEEPVIGVCLERSIDLVVALLAVLKAGFAYLPIDPKLPAHRSKYMLEDSQVEIVITKNFLESNAHLIAQEDSANFSLQRNDPLAYVIYTSGSTGNPKGVEICRSALNNLITALHAQWTFTAQDRWLALLSPSFDVSILELLFPLTQGATIRLSDQETSKDPFLLASEIGEDKGITAAIATPATWQMLVDAGWKGNPLLTLVSGGEALSNVLAEALLKRGKALWNLYGPTEATIAVSMKKIENAKDRITIGHPIINTIFHILDDKKQPVPLGMPGELYISGIGLARGYRNNLKLTGQAFFYIPSLGNRLYRTGDLVRYTPQHEVEFLGRLDQQIKLNGYRIELGEIEEVMRRSPGVIQVVCITQKDRIIAYYTGACSEEDLRREIGLHLPSYMIPSAFFKLEKMPLTFNGKIDRKALPLLSLSDETIAPPNNKIEQEIATIIGEVLGIQKVCCDRSFISLGGNSLTAVKVIARLNQLFQVKLTLKTFFENSSVTLLAKQLKPSSAGSKKIKLREDRMPLTDSQMRFWLLQQVHGNSSLYNVPLIFDIRVDNLNLDAFKKALHAIVERHEILRAYFTESALEPMQCIHPESQFEMEFMDLTQEVSAETKAQDIILRELKRVFNLTTYPLFHFLLIQKNSRHYVFCFHVHHIIFDGNSILIFMEELKSLYDAFISNRSTLLPPVTSQYIDLIQETSALEEEHLHWWAQKLKDAPPPLSLPSNKKRPAQQTFAGAILEFSFEKNEIQGIKKLSQASESTVFSLLLSLFYVLLYRYTNQNDRVLGIPVSGRTQPQEEHLIGCFINVLPLRYVLNGGETFLEVLKIGAFVTNWHLTSTLFPLIVF